MRLSNTSVEGKQFIAACHLYIIYFISFNITSLCFNVNVTCIDWYRTCIFRKTHRYKLHIAYCIWNYPYVTNYYCFFSACTNGTFGEKCKLTCGHCYGNSACDHVNGSCASGCASGWTGTVCNESKCFIELLHYITDNVTMKNMK